MHYPYPEVDHLSRLGSRAEIADVLVQGDIIVVDQGWAGLQRLGLDMVPDVFQIPLVFWRELQQLSQAVLQSEVCVRTHA